MKHLIIILAIISFSCKKDKIKPQQEEPPIQCNGKGYGNFTSKYYKTFDNPPYPAFTDTIEVKFTQDDCNYTQYKISNLYKAYSDLGIEIQDRDYYINVNESSGAGNIQDTMNVLINSNGILVSMKSKGTYVDITFKKK